MWEARLHGTQLLRSGPPHRFNEPGTMNIIEYLKTNYPNLLQPSVGVVGNHIFPDTKPDQDLLAMGGGKLKETVDPSFRPVPAVKGYKSQPLSDLIAALSIK